MAIPITSAPGPRAQWLRTLAPGSPLREEEALLGHVPLPNERFVGFLFRLAVLGGASALIGLIAVLFWLLV